jgi:hypothetical protein
MLVPACGSRCTREGASNEAEPARGRRGPSSEAEPARGGVALERGGTRSRGRGPRARRKPLEGALDWATLVGHGGHRRVGACLG